MDIDGVAGRRPVVVAACLVLLLGGCATDAPTPPPSSSAGKPPSEVTNDSAPASTDPPASEARSTWDPEDWTPTVRVARVTFTDEERKEYYDQLLERRAQDLNVENPPEVELVAWQQGLAAFGDAQARCLQDAGFPAVSDGVGGTYFDPGVPESQDEALGLASFICGAKYPVDPVYSQDWSSEQVALVYDYWDQYYIPCMEAHGHPIGRNDQPSRESFVASFGTPDRISWWPNMASQALEPQDRQSLAATCPEFPPDAAMYGQ